MSAVKRAGACLRRAILAPCGARVRRAKSASAAAGSACAFVALAALLSFVPDAAPDHRIATVDTAFAWPLRGALPGEPPAPGRPAAKVSAGLQPPGKRG